MPTKRRKTNAKVKTLATKSPSARNARSVKGGSRSLFSKTAAGKYYAKIVID